MAFFRLGKRDGDRLGFPVFPLQWQENKGYREKGFLPEAFVNMLSVLGWNDGTDEEMFSMQELLQKFDVQRINKAGAKFSFDKAVWYNAEWIKRMNPSDLLPLVKNELSAAGIESTDDKVLEVLALVQERISLLPNAVKEMEYFFRKPATIDTETIKKKWSEQHTAFYTDLKTIWTDAEWTKEKLETTFKDLIGKHEMKMGAVMLPFRIMLVGGKFGPGVFDIAQFLGREEVLERIINEWDSVSYSSAN
jgi:glutamyl-tRNA synthetase